MQQTINIILVDDHKILRDGLKSLLEEKAHLSVIAEASNGREAIKLCSKLSPDVVIIDVSMPELNGIEATRQILKQNPKIRVIALSMYASKQFIQEMFEAGAFGYLLKDGDSEELLTAIHSVMHLKKYLSVNLDQSILTHLKRGESITDTELSAREKEVLQLIAEGKSSKEIGELLFLSSKTVDVHRGNIMKKTSLYSIPELTKFAIKKGLTSLDLDS